MPGKFLAAFSNSGRYYAHICNDGKIRIWDVISCTLKQEYTPDVHLTSPFTDLHWILSTKKIDLSANRKRKSEFENESNEYLVLGSRSGNIYIYSVSTCSIVNSSKNGHNHRVNSISWNKSLPDTLFTCSEDQTVIHWNIVNCTALKKWKCGKMSCLAVAPDGKTLVTAKTEIKWWDISKEKENVLKTYTGHATDVISLNFVTVCGETCILSAATDNRFIHAWMLNESSEDRSAFATFAMDDALVSISAWNSSSGGLNLLASSRTGVLQSYLCTINGTKHTKPYKPKLTIQIACESDHGKSQAEQIPIVGANLCDENVAYITYGKDVILAFEKLTLTSTEKNMFIVRQDPRKKAISSKEQSANKILPTSTNKAVQYVPPEAVNGFLTTGNKKPQKRGHGDKTVDVPLELRLENLAVDVPSTVSAPASESLVHLLLQGLKSKDIRILHDVLLNKDENVIRTTINRLPVEAIMPLTTELVTMLQGKRIESDSAVKWLKVVLTVHAAHLISNPEVTEVFAPVFPIIESRLNVFGPLCRLVGRLELMVEQIKHRTEQLEKSLEKVNSQPKLIYQDEDSDEDEDNDSDAFKDEVISNNDSDDHWDDMSEIDEDSGQEQIQDIDMENTDT